ncbi:oxamate carbamoyltransferase subunit AllH family protein [Marinitoga aeolica]|uniref:oxamate carbamoyltransferase subunit AllH family protein n=1 Tax=Marinitoga aeolica TaxID=2809031 RepID=UPI0024788EB5|nr:DUF2877 domain-containing protein [Marinitoga aeolica]
MKKKHTAKEFFKTNHTKYFLFNDEDIFTLTTYDNRVGALGMSAPPHFLNFSTLKIANNSLIFDNTYLVENPILYDPKISTITFYEPIKNIYVKLKPLVDKRILNKIDSQLKSYNFTDLIGFGPGLTPLFDDILSGILLINSITKKIDTESILNIAKKKTNKLSYFQMFYAAKGYAPKPVKQYLESKNIQSLLKMGATSGLGWMWGISFFFDLEG